jgi:hypothetical protein
MDARLVAIPMLAAAVALGACARPAPTAPADSAVKATPGAVAPAMPTAVEASGDAETPVVEPGFPHAFEARRGAATSRAEEAPVLVAVRAAGHEDHDRIVFEFAGEGLPAWNVDWVAIPITHCGSGQVVPVAGTAWLQVRFNGAAAHTPEGRPTSGAAQRRLGEVAVRELARTCDFEGEVTWVAGLDARHPFAVATLSAPPRLVVDVAH